MWLHHRQSTQSRSPTKKMNIERCTALVSALAILRLESLLTPLGHRHNPEYTLYFVFTVWLVSVPEDREANSDEKVLVLVLQLARRCIVAHDTLSFTSFFRDGWQNNRTETKIVITVRNDRMTNDPSFSFFKLW
jgi:hypothetical protein